MKNILSKDRIRIANWFEFVFLHSFGHVFPILLRSLPYIFGFHLLVIKKHVAGVNGRVVLYKRVGRVTCYDLSSMSRYFYLPCMLLFQFGNSKLLVQLLFPVNFLSHSVHLSLFESIEKRGSKDMYVYVFFFWCF